MTDAPNRLVDVTLGLHAVVYSEFVEWLWRHDDYSPANLEEVYELFGGMAETPSRYQDYWQEFLDAKHPCGVCEEDDSRPDDRAPGYEIPPHDPYPRGER